MAMDLMNACPCTEYSGLASRACQLVGNLATAPQFLQLQDSKLPLQSLKI